VAVRELGGARWGVVSGASRAVTGIGNFALGVADAYSRGASDAVLTPGNDYERQLAHAESGSTGMSARNSRSSASGIFQFTDGTFVDMMRRYGSKYGVDASHMTRSQILSYKSDPRMHMALGREFTNENLKRLQSSPYAVNGTNLYAYHLLGPSGGPRMLEGVTSDPHGDARNYARADAVRANPSIFYNSAGHPRTTSEVYQILERKVPSTIDPTQVSIPRTATASSTSYETGPRSNAGPRVSTQQAAPTSVLANYSRGGGGSSSGRYNVDNVPFDDNGLGLPLLLAGF
jgi:hypothetical protein